MIAEVKIMNKFLEQALLYDFYGELLTEHQKDVYEQVVLEDYSLSEIAQMKGISRQMAEVERKHRREITDKDTRHKQEISFLKTVIAKAAAWFPYFREMLRIENLCRLVGFDERQTATLVKGKPLEYAGELYSEEHGRKFTTEKAGFQVVKDPTDGTRLVLAVDRKPIAEWFKEQFDKLRQNIRRPIQPQRKSRGMKL